MKQKSVFEKALSALVTFLAFAMAAAVIWLSLCGEMPEGEETRIEHHYIKR